MPVLSKSARNRVAELTAMLTTLYQNKPSKYCSDYLNLTLTPEQQNVMELLDTPPYRVLVRSANTTGKSTVAAARASYFLDCFPNSITHITAPTKPQVRDILFKELRSLRPNPYGFFPRDTRLELSHSHFVNGFTAATADSFQGRHNEYQGIVFDEATGIDKAFWDRAETMFGGHPGHWFLACYNPNDAGTPAYLAEESGQWHNVVLSALDHPNIRLELDGLLPIIPSAIRLTTILRRIDAECKEVSGSDYNTATDFDFYKRVGNSYVQQSYRPLTPEFEAQILGRWPISGNDSIWTPGEVDACFNRRLQLSMSDNLAAGGDIARFGADKTTLAIRRGPCLLHLEARSNLRAKDVAEWYKITLHHYAKDRDEAIKTPVYIDETGGYGSSVLDFSDGYNFVGINATTESPDPRYTNMRNYLWWHCKYIADNGILDFSRLSSEEKQRLKAELTTPHYHLDSKIRRIVEIKTQVKSRLGRSPDRADAVNLCYFLGA